MPASPTVPLNLNGYTDLPAGKVAAVVTYLEMRKPPLPSGRAAPAGWSLQPVGSDVARYKTLFRRIGEPWLWFSRVVMPEERLAALLASPGVEAYALSNGSQDVGLVELDFRSGHDVELVYFGVVQDVIGQGAGRFMMEEAVRRAFARPIERFFVHTCSLDHPGALSFYMRSGFVPYKRAIEVADDPRLLGLMPREAAPQIPVLDEPKQKGRT